MQSSFCESGLLLKEAAFSLPGAETVQQCWSYRRDRGFAVIPTPDIMPGFSSLSNAAPSVGHCEKQPRVTQVLQEHHQERWRASPATSVWIWTVRQADVSLKLLSAPLAEYANPPVLGETEKARGYPLPFKWEKVAHCFSQGCTSFQCMETPCWLFYFWQESIFLLFFNLCCRDVWTFSFWLLRTTEVNQYGSSNLNSEEGKWHIFKARTSSFYVTTAMGKRITHKVLLKQIRFALSLLFVFPQMVSLHSHPLMYTLPCPALRIPPILAAVPPLPPKSLHVFTVFIHSRSVFWGSLRSLSLVQEMQQGNQNQS